MKEKYLKTYMKTAHLFAELSSAQKQKVGCILVKDDRIISIGYNGMPSGWDNECETVDPNLYQSWMHKDDYALYDVLKTKPEVLHAEANAITKLARSSESGEGSTLFCTHMPCIECAKLIYQSGVSTVYYDQKYVSAKGSGEEFLKQCNLPVIQI